MNVKPSTANDLSRHVARRSGRTDIRPQVQLTEAEVVQAVQNFGRTHDAAVLRSLAGSADTVGLAARQWPEGTRVSGVDLYGVTRTGTVSGVDVGMVNNRAHQNYGRTYVGVNWDAGDRPESGYLLRERPFTDTLTRI
jgi:hypothetical protein